MEEFSFNASAIGAGGVIRRGDVTYVIPSLASLALAPTGGDGRSVVSGYNSEELAFTHAETRVYGREHPQGRVFTTYTYVFVAGLRVFDNLYIDEMYGTITSTRKFEDPDDHDFKVDLDYKGVHVRHRGEKDKAPIDPKKDECVKSVLRYGQLEQLLTGREIPRDVVPPSDKKKLAQRFQVTSADEAAKRFKEKKAVRGTIVESLEGRVDPRRHNRIYVEGLGTVIFGELVVTPGRRRLNLVRIILGDDADRNEFNESVDESQENPEAQPQRQTKRQAFAAERPEGPDSGSGGSMTVGSTEGNGTIVGP